MTDDVELRVYTTENGLELASFALVKKPGMWENIKNFFIRHEIKPYIRCEDLNN